MILFQHKSSRIFVVVRYLGTTAERLSSSLAGGCEIQGLDEVKLTVIPSLREIQAQTKSIRGTSGQKSGVTQPITCHLHKHGGNMTSTIYSHFLSTSYLSDSYIVGQGQRLPISIHLDCEIERPDASI